MDVKKLILKLGYLKFTVFQLSPISHEDLLNKIILRLTELDYNIISSSFEKIVFNSFREKVRKVRSVRVVSVTKYSKKIDIGLFDLYNSENGTTIKLSYFVTIISEIIMFLALCILALLTDYFVLFLSIVLLIRILIKVNKLKHVSKHLITTII